MGETNYYLVKFKVHVTIEPIFNTAQVNKNLRLDIMYTQEKALNISVLLTKNSNMMSHNDILQYSLISVLLPASEDGN